jgi:hypothetical protein
VFGLAFQAKRIRASLGLLVAALGGFALSAEPAWAVGLNAPFENIKYTANDNLRDFVGTHLGDPDLWPYVLELNQIESPADLTPGLILDLPVKQVQAADAALRKALDAIQTATSEGAQLFAPQEIGDAISNHDAALEYREITQWHKVVDLSDLATVLAKEALDIALAQRDRAAEAIVSDVQGAVEGRTPSAPRWSDRVREDILVEFERLRTLSNSTTQVTFRDLSRLRLNANSNATIQRMRSDPLTGNEVTKVSLVNGDFYALLNQLSDKSAFEIDVPGVTTTTQSTNFWVSNERGNAKFVNYDAANLRVQSGTSDINLSENEGVVLSNSGTQVAEVFQSAKLNAPALNAILYSGIVDLRWDAYDSAAGYWLEVASDPGFNQMVVSEWGIEGLHFETPELSAGRYQWRVAALDQLGLPGQWSKTRDFTIRNDKTPPFLTVLSPGDGTLSEEEIVEVFGASEPDATVLLNGKPLPVGSDGSFMINVTLQLGDNLLAIQATDLAGNVSDINQNVTYRAQTSVTILIDDLLPRAGDALATRSEALVVRAQTNAQPGAAVAIRSGTGEIIVQTQVNTDGSIGFGLPVTAQKAQFSIEILSPTGSIEGTQSFTAIRDQIPPQITLDLPPPKATDDPLLQLAGSADDALSLNLNGTTIDVIDGRFNTDITLNEDVNTMNLQATDSVGNRTTLNLHTVYDITPPDIISARATRPQGKAGTIEIVAQATDASGLRKSAPFLIEVGGQERHGFLLCETPSGVCRATLPAEPGTLRLIEVAIEDYAGNTAYN